MLLSKHFKYVECLHGFEVFYFRRQWNVRNDIFGLGIGYNQDKYVVSEDDIDRIYLLFKSYDEDNWENSGDSRWEFEEARPYLKTYADNLKKLKIIIRYFEVEVYFYDSY